MGWLTSKIVGGVVRHLVSGLGVWLVAEGYTDESTAETITGGAAALAAVVWSAREKIAG